MESVVTAKIEEFVAIFKMQRKPLPDLNAVFFGESPVSGPEALKEGTDDCSDVDDMYGDLELE
jgi:hypothetical protein